MCIYLQKSRTFLVFGAFYLSADFGLSFGQGILVLGGGRALFVEVVFGAVDVAMCWAS